jgi:hypothetical protein
MLITGGLYLALDRSPRRSRGGFARASARARVRCSPIEAAWQPATEIDVAGQE